MSLLRTLKSTTLRNGIDSRSSVVATSNSHPLKGSVEKSGNNTEIEWNRFTAFVLWQSEPRVFQIDSRRG
jgi:hypothetical protein